MGYRNLDEIAEESNNLSEDQKRFISYLAHDMKNPLNCILNVMDIVKTRCNNANVDNVDEIVELGMASARQLTAIVMNFLDYDRMTSGNVISEPEECSIRDVTDEVSSILGFLSRKYHVTVINESSEDTIYAPRHALVQVLTNLVSNAIKYSPKSGTVTITSTVREDSIVFGVRDTGRGIPEEFRDRIFGQYQQANASDTLEHSGTGVGLAVTKFLIEKMGGSIWYRSIVDNGTTFYFTVQKGYPYKAPAAQNSIEEKTAA